MHLPKLDFRAPTSENTNVRTAYTIGNLIGEGSYGIVVKAINLFSKRECAIKIIEKKNYYREMNSALQEER